MAQNRNPKNFIAKNFISEFISSQVVDRGLDERTEEAYRLDLEHLYRWLEKNGLEEESGEKDRVEKIQGYFLYLSQEKKLRPSTISRKYRVIGYYLKYLAKQEMMGECGQEKQNQDGKQRQTQEWGQEQGNKLIQEVAQGKIWATRNINRLGMTEEVNYLSKQEVDGFFQAIRREYESLESEFRRRVCLRDQIMMELLFYHEVEISELLKMKVSDYEPKTGILMIPKKRDKGQEVSLFSRKLQEQMERWLMEHEYFEQDNEFQGRMFLSKLGRPLSMKMVINIFEKYRVLAGIEKEYTPKDLKKSMKGYAREVVREICGQGE